MQDQARVVIIGGGVVGWGHLAVMPIVRVNQ